MRRLPSALLTLALLAFALIVVWPPGAERADAPGPGVSRVVAAGYDHAPAAPRCSDREVPAAQPPAAPRLTATFSSLACAVHTALSSHRPDTPPVRAGRRGPPPDLHSLSILRI
ncbi:hypothetical protein FHS43_006643 [Streptosporangium becharense]|uniref:Uncharacterized protein n=1 Tax=Streptosporangium becharense TaxID=1816182 RepID=A0A7W9IA65_9ACTN|nr:hypothetical protein [Streptosporangium becharense]MBB2915323.1 hypothetical protein [Streptosporangium becharense]MBB5816979.1 hypothetical protein [Streptosporangium becharense]